MRVNLLGPIEAVSADGTVSLGGAKQRAVLAMLALQAGSTVSADRLIDGLWGDQPPASALKLVQLYVSHLRKALGEEELIATHGRGYELCLARQDVDAGRFERLLAQGAAREALRLWRGSPLADVQAEPFAAPEIRRLEELHTAALEVAIDQDLDAGRHREVLPEIDGLLATEPLREPLHARRMLALYRCGRQADALAAYREARRTLIEQVGVEPGPELRRLHEAMLRQDPVLDPPVDGSGRTPLFGRERELGRLRALWQRVREGGRATALITGEPGIGKTRLTLALAEEVRREGGEVSWGDAAALTPGRPALLVLDGAGMPPDDGTALVVLTSLEPDGLVADERIALGPLEPGEAARLARFDAGDDGPVDRIVRASQGVPGLIRRAARDWARAQAMARVADAAARTSADRLQWQLAESDLTTRVVELQEIREPASTATGACPYKGLASFDVEDASVFFGRERLVAEMVARLPGAHLLGIVGPSGSGKSSAMRAGLLAAIGAGVLPGSETWTRRVIRPGEHPALPELPAGPAVLAVDQFEELFTVCRDEHERAGFVEALVDRARRGTLVLVAVRADFYGACARYSELSRALGRNHVLVGPMRRDELRRAVVLPARHAGIAIEPALTDALVADVEHEPGALPLLSTALLELWDEGLTLDAYERTGGVRGAVSRLAETAFGRLDDDGRAEARRILLRLAGDGDVRTRVPLGELGDGAILAELARDRLVTVGEDEAEVAHEALLREWPRLRSWLEEDAEGRRLHQQLTLAARDWTGDASELYRGARLASVLDWLPGHEADLNEPERAYLAASREAAERESARQRRANRRLRVLLGGVACLLALAVVAGIVALNQRGEARRATVVADAQRLGEEAQLEVRFDRALLLARAGVALDDSLATRGSLLSVLQRNPPALGAVDIGWRMFTVAITPDSRLIAVGDERGVVSLFDTATRRSAGTYTIPGGLIQRLRFSPDGRTLAVGSSDPRDQSDNAIVDLIDPRTRRLRSRIRLEPVPRHVGYTLATPVFVTGGDLDIEQMSAGDPGEPPPVIYHVDAKTGAITRRARVGRHPSQVFSATADGRRVFVSNQRDNATWMLDATTLRVLRSYPAGEDAGAVSADGRVFALGSPDGHVRVLDTGTGAVRAFADGDGRPIGALTFTPDGRKLVTAGDQGTVLVWDVEHGEVAETLTGHTEEAGSMDVSGDGRTLVSGSSDGRAIVYDLAGDRRLVRPFSSGGPFDGINTPRGMAVSPDGRTLAFTNGDGGVQLMDARTLRPERSVHAVRPPRRPGTSDCERCAAAVAFSPDGRLMAVGGAHGQVTLWDARTLRRLTALPRLRGGVQALAFSPDGRLLAYGEGDIPYPRTLIWDVRARRLATRPIVCRRRDAQCPVASLAFSPDSRLIAEAQDEAGTEIRDVRTGRLITTLGKGGESRSVAFSPDGKLVVVGQFDGKGYTFSTTDWKRLPQSLDEHTKRINSIVFTPDSRTMATASEDGTVQLWDVATDRRIGGPFPFETGTWAAATFSRDGRYLFAMSTTGDGIRFDMSPAAWSRHACQMAGRELTVREWRDALPGRPYRRLCGATPKP